MYGLPCVHYIILKFWHCLRRNSRKLQESTEPIEIRAFDQTVNSEAADKNVFNDKKLKPARIYSLYFNLYIWIWILYLAIVADNEEYEEKYQYHDILFAVNILGYVHVPSFALYMYAEVFFCWEWELLGKVKTEKTCRTYFEQLTKTAPVVTVTISAYHMKSSYYTGSYKWDGKSVSYTMPCQAKVVDYEESREFAFSRWEDITPSLDSLSLDTSKLTKLVLTKTAYLGDEDTRNKLSQLVTELDSSVRGMSPNSEVETIIKEDITEFNDEFVAYLESQQQKWWLKRWVLVFATFFLCTWVYRIFFFTSTQRVDVRIQKSIYAS